MAEKIRGCCSKVSENPIITGMKEKNQKERWNGAK